MDCFHYPLDTETLLRKKRRLRRELPRQRRREALVHAGDIQPAQTGIAAAGADGRTTGRRRAVRAAAVVRAARAHLRLDAVAEALDGLPAHKLHCSVLAEEAVKSAVQDYYERNNIPYDKSKFPKQEDCESCRMV